MTATFLLIRHAMHTDYNVRFSGRRDGVLLSQAGEAQALSLGERLAKEPIETIYASPRDRTRATADAIAAHHALRTVIEPELDEIDLGNWTGAEIASLRGDPLFDQWNTRRSVTTPPNGEPYASVAERAHACVQGLAERHPGKLVALVSHQDVIKGLIATCLGLSLDHVLRFDVGPASISRLVVGDWGAKLLTLNEGAAD